MVNTMRKLLGCAIAGAAAGGGECVVSFDMR
jgi:hypothetical protein